jgi:hypothetical protein
MNALGAARAHQRRVLVRPDPRRSERLTVAELDEQERQAGRCDLRRMGPADDRVRIEPEARGHRVDGRFGAERERLRRSEFAEHGLTADAADREGDRPGALFEHDLGDGPVSRDGTGRSEHECGAYIRVAGERDLGAGSEDAHLARVPRALGRQHERGLGIVELARAIRCICSPDSRAASGSTAS